MRNIVLTIVAITTAVALTACAEREQSKSGEVCSGDICVAISFACTNGKRDGIAIVVSNSTKAPVTVRISTEGDGDPVEQEGKLPPDELMTATDKAPRPTTFTYTVYVNDKELSAVELGRNEDCLKGDVPAE